jgi:hypothetical protein
VKSVKFHCNNPGDLLFGNILCGVLTGYEYNISYCYFINIYVDLFFVYLTVLLVAKIYLNILPSMSRPLKWYFFLKVFPPKLYISGPVYLIIFYLIIISTRSTNYECPHFAVLSNLFLLPPSEVQIFSALFSNISSYLNMRDRVSCQYKQA